MKKKSNQKTVKKTKEQILKKVNSTYSQLKKTLSEHKEAAAAAVASALLFAAAVYGLSGSTHPSSFTVMITNPAGTGGGSGSVVETSSGESKVLTNAHVCEGALKKGGKIRKVNGEEHRVTGYYLSDEHDLCLVTVAADLGASVEIANSAPALYEEATVTGHPSLMPNVISKGHFGGRMIIQIITGIRKCTEEEKKDPEKEFSCMMFGGILVVKSFEAAAVSATIMPGSSGSAVLNSSNELSGVVFAGNSRGLSYALIVPYEAVRNFLHKEMKLKQTGKKLRPWEDPQTSTEEEQSLAKIIENIRKTCQDPNAQEKAKNICAKVKDGSLVQGAE